MENKSILLIFAVIVVLLIAGVIAGNTIITQDNQTPENDSLNLSINETDNNTTTTEKVTSTKTKTDKKSKDPNIVGESIKENYQQGDGSHYREVQYKDGNIRQYNSKGELIGSTFDSDQDYLKDKYGDMS